MLKIISRWAIPINLMEKGVDREFWFFCFNFKGLIVCTISYNIFLANKFDFHLIGVFFI
jgi:hypothetical protein